MLTHNDRTMVNCNKLGVNNNSWDRKIKKVKLKVHDSQDVDDRIMLDEDYDKSLKKLTEDNFNLRLHCHYLEEKFKNFNCADKEVKNAKPTTSEESAKGKDRNADALAKLQMEMEQMTNQQRDLKNSKDKVLDGSLILKRENEQLKCQTKCLQEEIKTIQERCIENCEEKKMLEKVMQQMQEDISIYKARLFEYGQHLEVLTQERVSLEVEKERWKCDYLMRCHPNADNCSRSKPGRPQQFLSSRQQRRRRGGGFNGRNSRRRRRGGDSEEIEDKGGDLPEIRALDSDDATTLRLKMASLSKQKTLLQQRVKNLRSSCNSMDGAYKTKLSALELQYKQEAREREKFFNKKIENLTTECNQEVKNVKTSAQKQLDTMASQMDLEKKDLVGRLRTLQDQYDSEQRKWEKQYDRAIENAKAEQQKLKVEASSKIELLNTTLQSLKVKTNETLQKHNTEVLQTRKDNKNMRKMVSDLGRQLDEQKKKIDDQKKKIEFYENKKNIQAISTLINKNATDRSAVSNPEVNNQNKRVLYNRDLSSTISADGLTDNISSLTSEAPDLLSEFK